MFRTWLRRWLGLEEASDAQLITRGGLERRVAELEDHVDYLHGGLRKLRGRVTGGLRADPDPARANGEPEQGAPPVHAGVSGARQWDLAALERTRMQEYGRLVKGDRP